MSRSNGNRHSVGDERVRTHQVNTAGVPGGDRRTDPVGSGVSPLPPRVPTSQTFVIRRGRPTAIYGGTTT